MTARHLFNEWLRRLKKSIVKLFMTPKKQARASYKLLKKIKEKMNPEHTAILTGMGIGDMLYAMGFVNAYLDQNPGKKALIVARDAHADIIRSYGDFDIFPITKLHAGVYSFIMRNGFTTDGEDNIINTYNLWNCSGANIIDKMRGLFEISENTSIQYHNLESKKVSSIPNFYKNCKKIIIINPYANSCRYPQEVYEQLETLVRYLKKTDNYDIYSNVVKDQLPVRGTKELRCNLAELLEMASYVPFIISVRSGVLDFLIKTNVDMFVIHEHKECVALYGLSKWQCSGILKEITIDDFVSDSNFTAFSNFIAEIEDKGSSL